MNPTRMRDLIAKLGPFRSGVVCKGADQTIAALAQECPGAVVHEYPSGKEVNGWIVPQAWEVTKATIKTASPKMTLDGPRYELSYDGMRHNLGVAQYSQPFKGQVRGSELKRHLFFSEPYPNELIYHCTWWYKPHIKDWGMCVPKTLFDQVQAGALYDVDLQTTFTPGTMKVLEWVLPGDSEESIALLAHTCHPGLANDDLAGCAVGIEVMRRLAALPKRRFTYRLLLSPEHYGPIFYLDQFGRNKIRYSLFMESLGSSGPLVLQQSFDGYTPIDRVFPKIPAYGFRMLVGNCETVMEAAGYEIPCPSLSRVPFPEYHTSLDTVDIIHEEKLQEAAALITEAMTVLDRDVVMHRKFTGLVCLSNPKYDLYKPMLDPSIAELRTITPEARTWNHLMDKLPRYFDGKTSCLDIAQRFNLPFQAVRDYVQQFADKGLVALETR